MPGNYFGNAGDAIARARLRVASTIGVTVSFTHRATAAVPIVMKIISDRIERTEEGGVISEIRIVTGIIATGQTGFAAATNDIEPITAGDSIVYLSRTMYAADPIGKDKFGKTFTVKWHEKKRFSSGNR